jgi:hypothetical protein
MNQPKCTNLSERILCYIPHDMFSFHLNPSPLICIILIRKVIFVHPGTIQIYTAGEVVMTATVKITAFAM